MIFKWLKNRCYPDYPVAATAEVWTELHKKEKEKPICNFCVNVVPAFFRKKIRILRDLKYWFLYRIHPSHKYQLIDTGLKPSYYEIDYRMLHGMFNLLKEFCEKEMPQHDWCWQEASKAIDAEKNGTTYKKRKLVFGKQAALESLGWQKKLVYTTDDVWRDEDQHLIGTPTPQAIKATEIEQLYLWWVETRPARVDPFELYEDTLMKKRLDNTKLNGPLSFFCKGTEEEEKLKTERYNKIDELEKKYEAEDQDMLIRLIKIRKSLWT